MATDPTPRLLDTFNASEELAELAERDAAARQVAWDDRVQRLLRAVDAARDHAITSTADKGAVGSTAGKNYYLEWAMKWVALADALRDGGWLPHFNAVRAYLASEDGRKSDQSAFSRTAELLAGVLELKKDRKEDIETLADALPRLRRKEVGNQTLGGELGGLIQAMTMTAYQAAFCGWPKDWGPAPEDLGPEGGGPPQERTDDARRTLTAESIPASAAAAKPASDGGQGHDKRTPVYLTTWRDILTALDLTQGKKNTVKKLHREHPGPIIMPGQGGQPKVERAALLQWWEGIQRRWDELSQKGENRKATLESGYEYGRDGMVLPDISGGLKKRREDRKP